MELPKTINKSKSGFTLIELLVYLAIFGIAAGLLSGILAVFVRVQSQEAAGAELTQQLSFVQSTIQRLVREAVNIENPAGVASSALKLRMEDASKDPTCLSLINGVIKLAEGPDPANHENCTPETSDLTSDRVSVSQFEVVKYENPGAHAIVQLDFSLSYNSQRTYQQITRGLKTAIGRVTAATFDDSLLPNTASNSFTVGNPTYPWKSLTLSNVLNLGQLTDDPQAGNQNGSIYYNSVDNAFRGYKAGAWTNLGESSWMTSGVNIYNTNSGNVGIGTANPGAKLSISQDGSIIQTELTRAVDKAGVLISFASVVDVFTPGLFWTSLETPTKPKAGIYLLNTNAGTKMYFGTSNAYSTGITNEAMVINEVGNVGIGTTGPTNKLQVNGDVVRFERQNTALDTLDFNMMSDTIPRILSSGHLGFIVGTAKSYRFDIGSGNEVMRINAAGNVGIGEMSPGSKLSVKGGMTVGNDIAYSQIAAPTDGMIIKGNVGIGTNSPGDYKLDVVGGKFRAADNTYDSGWFPIVQSTTYTKTHSLGTTKVIPVVYYSESSDGSGNVIPLAISYLANYSLSSQNFINIVDLDSTTVDIRTAPNNLVDYIDKNGVIQSKTSGYLRVLLLALE